MSEDATTNASSEAGTAPEAEDAAPPAGDSARLSGDSQQHAFDSCPGAESTRELAEASLLERLKRVHTYRNSALQPDDRERLDGVYAHMQEASKTLAGYPCNQVFDYTELLPFLAFSLNNVGDPFADSNYRLNTHDIEREVLADFSRLTHASEQDVWGYVTSGGTEGNLYGLYLARELFPTGIVYYSEDTHYSVAKSLRLLRARSIMIRSQDSGEIDYDDLREALKIHRDVPPILFLNIGTTMKGAIDRVETVRGILGDLRLKEHYIHCDAALSGMILPFLPDAPPWDFAAGVDSLSISGHKMLGAPVPCGVVLARRKYVERIARSVEYVGVLDTTIGGSRSAFAPLVLWYALRRWGIDGLTDLVEDCQANAEYAVEEMRAHGIDAWRHEHSITVVLPRPSDNVVRRFQIAPQGNLGHLITMPHVTRRRIDQFIEHYLADPPTTFVRCARPLPGSHLRPGSLPPPAEPAPTQASPSVPAFAAPVVPTIDPPRAGSFPSPAAQAGTAPGPSSAPRTGAALRPSSAPGLSSAPRTGAAPRPSSAPPRGAASPGSWPPDSLPPPTKHSAKEAPLASGAASDAHQRGASLPTPASSPKSSKVRESYTNEVDNQDEPPIDAKGREGTA